MSEIPSNWVEVPLGELGEWRGGGTPSKSNSDFWTDGEIPWVSPKDMKRPVIDDALDHITEQAIKGSATQLVPEGSVLLVTRSGILQHTLPVAVNSREVAINQDIKALTPASGADPNFIAAQLKSSASDILRSCAKSGTTVDSIDFDRLKTFPVVLPPALEQRRIVAKLDSLRDRSARARQELDRIPKLIERYKQAIIAKAFSGELTADWRKHHSNVAPLKPLLDAHRKAIKRNFLSPSASGNSELNLLPKGWSWLQAQDATEPDAEIVYGIVQPGPKLETGIPYVRGMDIQHGEIRVDQLMKTSSAIAERYSRAALRGGDVLLGIIRETKVAIVPKSLDGANITQGTARIRPADFISSEYLAYWLRSNFAQMWLHDHYRGIDMPGLNLRDVRRLPVPVAPPGEQIEIVRLVSLSLNWLKRVSTEHSHADHLLPKLDEAILAKAFRGELVPQDPNDEPASALLARIRTERGEGNDQTRRRRARNS